MEDSKHKSFTLSVDLLLTIVLVLSIFAAWSINSLNNKITVLEENQGYLQDHDEEMQELKQKLFIEALKE